MDLLNELYQHFDDAVDAYNVWKVETIGDAYLVASGVPDQREDHATEICKMSLDLLSKVGREGFCGTDMYSLTVTKQEGNGPIDLRRQGQ